MSGYSDAELVLKLNAKMRRVIDNNEIALECEFSLKLDLDKEIIPELSKLIVNGLTNYEPDPNVPTLIRCVIRHKVDDFYQETFYRLNPDHYLPPDKIKVKEIQNLVKLLKDRIAESQNEIEGDKSKYVVIIDLYALYSSS